jgi:hypothetical protein
MAVKRVRAAITGLQDERNRLGWSPIVPALEKRIREALATPGRPGNAQDRCFGLASILRISGPFVALSVVAIVPPPLHQQGQLVGVAT